MGRGTRHEGVLGKRPSELRFERSWAAPVLLGPVVVAWLGACSATLVEHTDCDDDRPCREAFGVGSTCSDGYCTAPAIHPRCSRTHPSDLLDDPQAYADRIVLGSLFSYTDHLDTLLATELAVRQVNNRAGLDGQRYAIVHCDYTPLQGDDLDDIAASERMAAHLVETVGVPAIVGPRGSSRTEAAFNAIRGTGTVLISPSATSPDLTALDETEPTATTPGFLWRTAPPDSLQSEVIAVDMIARDKRRVAAIYQSGAYGDGLKELFVRRFTELGGESVDEFPFSDSEFADAVATVAEGLREQNYSEVLFISSDIADYIDFFNAATATPSLREAYGAEGVGLFLPDAAYDDDLLQDTAAAAGALFVNVRGTRPAPADGPLFNAFAAAYAAEYRMDPAASAYTAHSYDAAWLVVYGTAWSMFDEGGISGLGIARGLRRVSAGDRVEITSSGWPLVVDRFRNGDGVDVQGASGPLDYDDATEETRAPISLWRIEPVGSGFAFVEIERIEPE